MVINVMEHAQVLTLIGHGLGADPVKSRL